MIRFGFHSVFLSGIDLSFWDQPIRELAAHAARDVLHKKGQGDRDGKTSEARQTHDQNRIMDANAEEGKNTPIYRNVT
jgi:hypothetical protein